MSNQFLVSREVQKYPYCGQTHETEDYLSEKICRLTIKIRKKAIRKAKWLMFYADFAIHLSNDIVPHQAIGLSIPPQILPTMRSIDSNTYQDVFILSLSS